LDIRNAATRRTDVAFAVRAAIANGVDSAPLAFGRAQATAIHVAFVLVRDLVVAGARDTNGVFTHAALAVLRLLAVITVGAGITHATPAIGIRLVVVLLAAFAVLDAHLVLASAALAIAVEIAAEAKVARLVGRTRAAAVDGCFFLVLHVVVATRIAAHVAGAELREAVFVDHAARVQLAAVALTTAAILVRLAAIAHAIGTVGGWHDGAAGASGAGGVARSSCLTGGACCRLGAAASGSAGAGSGAAAAIVARAAAIVQARLVAGGQR